ncbi:helix-turn-helix domain-containing protein [Microbacterium sp. 3J1]|uniref:helix-turn-helix domain-containing protein n=1 Tax=Microbacterium sp. 3J1 TaxID=861269 RepID=UPI000A8C3FAA|nr:helix-turn-helix domain-containing protein [Microbacterium sp. 3J1]
MSQNPFGAMLRDRRVARDLTLEALSEASGVSERGIGDIERGVSVAPQVRTVRLLADALQLRGAEREVFLHTARSVRQQRREVASTVMPTPLADFVGRIDELARLRSAVGDSGGAALLWGAPGIGKTSLALEAARLFADEGARVLFADLQGLDARPASPLAVIQAILGQVARPEQFVATDLGAAMRLWSEDTTRRHIVVLDNAGSEAQVRPLLANPGALVIVTSRRPLSGLERIHRLRIDPLAQSESEVLLASLAPTLNAGDPHTRELAQLCGRIPLALRVAGNRLATRPDWSAEDLLFRLRNADTRLDTLRAGDLEVKNAVDLSYELLSESARSLFGVCSLLDGSTFSADLPAAILQVSQRTAEHSLDELIELALVETSAGGRYRMHDLLRLYGRDRLDEALGSREVATLEKNKVSWLLQRTFEYGQLFEPDTQEAIPTERRAIEEEQPAARAWLVANAEHWLAALRAAHAAGLHADVLRVADSLHWFSDLWLKWGNWHTVFRLSVSSAVAIADRSEQARHLGYLSWADRMERWDLAQSLVHAEAALDAATSADDAEQIAWSHMYIAEVQTATGEQAEAQRHAHAAAELFERMRNKEGFPQALLTLSASKLFEAKFEEALIDAERAAAWVEDPATAPAHNIARHALVNARIGMASAALGTTQPETALAAAHAALQAAEELDLAQGAGLAHLRIGRAHRMNGDEESARAAFARAAETFAQIGDLRGETVARAELDPPLPEAD